MGAFTRHAAGEPTDERQAGFILGAIGVFPSNALRRNAKRAQALRAVVAHARQRPQARGLVCGCDLIAVENAGADGDQLLRCSFGDEHRLIATFDDDRWNPGVLVDLGQSAFGGEVAVDWLACRADYFDTAVSRGEAGLWRCLVMAVDNGTPASAIRQFERDLLVMPGHVSAIRNWALGDVVAGGGRRRWTHIWEQEFVDIAGLEGEYMTHPVHWGLVDGWFDPECPQRIVDPMLIHAAMDIRGSVIV